MKTVIGIGNAITDIPVFLPDNSLLEEFNFVVGSMNHIDAESMEKLWGRVKGYAGKYIAGGSAANTIATMAQLGMKGRFVGMTGADEAGEMFVRGHGSSGVEMVMYDGKGPSGRALAFINGKDGERTFATCLGAALEFTPDEVSAEMFHGADILHTEGYMLQCPGVVERAMEMARGKGMTISMDLGSMGIVKRYKDELHAIVEEYADIVFANEDEAEAFTGLHGEEALDYIYEKVSGGGKKFPVAVVKLGAEGSLVKSREGVNVIGAVPANVVDTTGAGDIYAAGFLYAFSCGAVPRRCGEVGSLLASRVVETVGSKIFDVSLADDLL